ncbi:hypothetical protein [Nocardioides convexus]|uniref:hypothetical protein n=1 Tax=Nocardioides convexus TaxID=2712224 RepID=UPI0024189ED1|nr:hypothetical protein [Nocardioides convexus]
MMQSGRSAIDSSRSVVALIPSSRPSPASLPGVLAVLAGGGGPDPDELEVGVGVDARDGVPADGSGGPDDDPQRLLGDDL